MDKMTAHFSDELPNGKRRPKVIQMNGRDGRRPRLFD